MTWLPSWPPRDWRAFIALLGSIFGAFSLSVSIGWIVWILWTGGWPESTAPARIEALSQALMMQIIGQLLVLGSLGLAINRRSVKLDRTGFEMSGGDADAPASTTVTTTVTPGK